MFFKHLYPLFESKIRNRLNDLFSTYQDGIAIPDSFWNDPKYLDKEVTIDQAYHSTPEAKEIFNAYNLSACDHCSVRFDETLEEAAQAYNISLEIWQIQLNCKIFNRYT